MPNMYSYLLFKSPYMKIEENWGTAWSFHPSSYIRENHTLPETLNFWAVPKQALKCQLHWAHNADMYGQTLCKRAEVRYILWKITTFCSWKLTDIWFRNKLENLLVCVSDIFNSQKHRPQYIRKVLGESNQLYCGFQCRANFQAAISLNITKRTFNIFYGPFFPARWH